METGIRFELTGVKSLQQQLDRLKGNEVKKILYMALNKVGAKAQTAADRAIRERFNISREQVRGSFVFIRAHSTTNAVEAVLRIFGSTKRLGRSLNLIHFVERSVTLAEQRKRVKKGTQKALRFKILRRGGGLKTTDGAFIGNKGRTVFKRTGAARLPIEPVQVIGVSQMFNTRVVADRVRQKILQELDVEVRRAVDLVISRR